jgi:hypothetical protein
LPNVIKPFFILSADIYPTSVKGNWQFLIWQYYVKSK